MGKRFVTVTGTRFPDAKTDWCSRAQDVLWWTGIFRFCLVAFFSVCPQSTARKLQKAAWCPSLPPAMASVRKQ